MSLINSLEQEKQQYRTLKSQLENFSNSTADGVGSLKRASGELNASFKINDSIADNGLIGEIAGGLGGLVEELSIRVVPAINARINEIDNQISAEYRRIEEERKAEERRIEEERRKRETIKSSNKPEGKGVNVAF